jgi:hypothetical protein
MKVYLLTTNARNGGFGIISNAIKALFTKWGWKITDKPEADVNMCFLYGMVGDLITKYLVDWEGKKRPFTIFYTVWESSEYPPEWTNDFKRAKIDLVLTASEYIKKAIEANGCLCQVWRHGIDDRFVFKKRPDDGIFTFYHYNAFEYRKGWEIVLEAFTNEFHIEEPVKLVLKGRELRECRWIFPESGEKEFKIHPNVDIVVGHVTDEKMVELSDKADCFVFPAKGEGWGLPPCEMMAVGCPAIIPNAHSFTEFFDEKDTIPVEVDGYLNSEPRYRGYLIHCSVKDLQKKMRWAFENQNKMKEMGGKASERMHKDFNWDKIGQDLLKIIDKELK